MRSWYRCGGWERYNTRKKDIAKQKHCKDTANIKLVFGFGLVCVN
jgi:hypothetical protein